MDINLKKNHPPFIKIKNYLFNKESVIKREEKTRNHTQVQFRSFCTTILGIENDQIKA